MYTKETTASRSARYSVHIKNSNGRLQLVFSHGGQRYYLSLGLPDTPLTRKTAEAKAKLIESDIAHGRFDETLANYKPQSSLTTAQPPASIEKSQVKLGELWGKYVQYKTPQVSQTTLARDYLRWQSHISKLPTDNLSDAVQIRDFLLSHYSPNTAKRCLTNFSACCDWALKAGLTGANPFNGMAAEVKMPKSQFEEAEINPFTAEERDHIIQAFTENRYYSHYASFIKFLFLTGSRPSEAIALEWHHIAPDFTQVTFEQAVTPSAEGLAVKKGLKTQELRKFPCNASLRAFLQSIKPERAVPTDPVFPSPRGGYIDFNNFRNRAWKTILASLSLEYRRPYQTRHSFITLALENGLDAKDVARLVGNSAEVIYRHYASGQRSLVVPEF